MRQSLALVLVDAVTRLEDSAWLIDGVTLGEINADTPQHGHYFLGLGPFRDRLFAGQMAYFVD
jgi:hypothetical protein